MTIQQLMIKKLSQIGKFILQNQALSTIFVQLHHAQLVHWILDRMFMLKLLLLKRVKEH